jgi:hypothetical protein
MDGRIPLFWGYAMKSLFYIVMGLAVLSSCSTAGKSGGSGTQPSIYTVVAEDANRHYSAWITDSDKDSAVMYYSDSGNYTNLVNIREGMATGWYHFIYYNNKTKFKNLYSVMILGYYSGNADKEFTFSVENLRGDVLYQSPAHRFSEFPRASDKLALKEFVVDLKNTPEELIIKLKTGSNPTDSLFIVNIPNAKNVFSYEYSDPYTYTRYKDSNAAIFPKFK